MGSKLESSLAILNGAIGDYLARTGNGLATDMILLTRSAATLDRRPLEGGEARQRVVVLVHGLMCTESVWEMPDRSDYGSLLARDLGYVPFYVQYNSGLPIADNGAKLAQAIESKVREVPVPIEQIVLLGHSMGGLVVRAACHTAALEGHQWLRLARRAIYLGTPHLGAPLERMGRVVAKLLGRVDDPYARLVAEIANLRSDGMKDLGDADLRHEDRARGGPAVGMRDPRHPVPLLPGMRHYLIAGTLSEDSWVATLFGDALVSVASATNGHVDPRSAALPPSHVKLLGGLGHMALAHDPCVYTFIRAWCEGRDDSAEEDR
jgi:triacylglycerol lipase